MVRSNFPTAFRKFMSEILMDILQDVEKEIIDMKIINFKKEMKELPVTDIALPTGVKHIKKFLAKGNSNRIFSDVNKGTPAHVKAAITYNDLMKHFKLHKKHELISNGEKIKWVYLKKNTLNIPAIGFKGYDDPPKIMKFVEEFVDHNKIFESVLKNKLDLFYEALSWTEPTDKTKTMEQFF